MLVSVCLSTMTAHGASYYAKANFQLHATPIDGSTVDSTAVPAGALVDDVSTKATVRSSWVLVRFKSNGAAHQGWVKARLLAGPHDFSKVNSCWPIARSSATSGEASWDVDFSVDGSAILKSTNGGAPIAAHVYRSDNIVFVRANKRMPRSTSIFGYSIWGLPFIFDADKRQLQAIDYDSETLARSPEALTGCQGTAASGPPSARPPSPAPSDVAE